MEKVMSPITIQLKQLLRAASLCTLLVGIQARLLAQEPVEGTAETPDTPDATIEETAAMDEASVAGVEMHPGELNKDEQIRRQEQALLGELALEEGNAALVKGDYEKAVESFGLAKGRFENAGTTSDVQKKIAGIDALIAKAYKMWADELAHAAEQDYDAEKFDDAIEKVKKIAELNPDMAPLADERIRRYEMARQNVILRKQLTSKSIDPKGEEREMDIDLLLGQGDRLYKKGLFIKSKEAYEQVLVADPFNIEAIDNLVKVQRQIRARGQQRRKIVEMERIAESTWKWSEPITTVKSDSPLDDDTEPVPLGEETSGIRKKLDEIILDRIDFEEATIHQVIRYLREKSIQLDPEGKGVSIVYQGGGAAKPDSAPESAPVEDPGGFEGGFEFDDGGAEAPAGGLGTPPATDASAAATVTIAASDIPLGDAIRFICESASLDFMVTKYAVLIGTTLTRKMDVKIFDVPQGMFSITANAGGDGGMDDGWGIGDTGGGGGGGGGGGEMDEANMVEYLTGLGIEFPPESAAKLIRNKTKLWVKNTPENLELVDDFLTANVIEEGQVTIEAKFVEINQNDLEALGFEWMLNNGAKYGESGMGGYTDFGSWGGSSIYSQGSVNAKQPLVGDKAFYDAAGNIVGIATDAVLGFEDIYDENGQLVKVAAGYPLNSALTGALRFAGDAYGMNSAILGVNTVLGSMDFDTVIHALDRADSTDVLSCPKVTTKNNQTAVLKVITERYFPESWTEPELETNDNGNSYTPSIAQFGAPTEIGVILNATPSVDPKNNYTIDLLLTPSVVDFLGMDDQFDYEVIIDGEPAKAKQQMPIISRRMVETNVMVRDGETVVLGGLINEKIVTTDDKVPILGDIPFVGRLFRSHTEDSQKRNLLIFVTARIVDSSGRPRITVAAEKASSDDPKTRGIVDFGR